VWIHESEPSDKIADAVIVQNGFRHNEVDRSLVSVADAPSLTSATRFQHRESKGAQNQGLRYEIGRIVFD